MEFLFLIWAVPASFGLGIAATLAVLKRPSTDEPRATCRRSRDETLKLLRELDRQALAEGKTLPPITASDYFEALTRHW